MFQGSIVALITPFRDGRLDEEALRRLVEWHVEQGTHGIVPVGTTGESPTLTHDEHCRVIEVVVEQVAGRVPVIAGAGSNNPVEAIEYTRHAERAGADATLHVAGYYNRPNQEGLYHHFKAVHDATELPIILYNIPPRAIVDIQPQTLARLAELPRILGVKDATGDLARPWLERQLIKKPFSWLSGEDATAVAYNVGGGTGCISVTANVAPAMVAEVQNLTLAGRWEEARALQDRLIPLHQAMFAEPSPAGAKYAASLLGFCSEECRLPVMPLGEATKVRIRQVMQELGLLEK
ncbi:4-hydroxy-tetrahydrodipicolinate synthase [Aeromonas schubertii]|uniref:4-hydroxy-tetrahydrodipicolinate synthase n=1 Tax=Aeromonas schubertii TaxID=652 RepID=A0A0S2SEX0_9GAMM|nr:4-hydroxy-tetrahydrodipicolinate synthase [Aeromonas schubertii]ALP40254.1 dihydrodipicolinate synthase [Aeromonas schubertii]MBZ6067132.1 4-hydroxy-tetrahydrodipicolinate synthase [Aeromonas schubertii]MBZ6074183.1 4-hydroxy-tetrahydrodipicolinate synthase [Aeromonas schubertii]QCG49428.1 4-hydroxy-tetrahydrodipicolinate synthase [Aeromonas schubertii]